MCNFFSFVTNPDHDGNYYYFDWQMRQVDGEGADSHAHICAHYRINEDTCNKYEYNPITKVFEVDMQNAEKDDKRRAKRWVQSLDWKLIIEPLVVKPIVDPLELPKVEKPTNEQIRWLKEWTSVWDSVGASVWDSVWTSVLDSVRASVLDSVRASVRASVWASVRASVWTSVLDSVLDSVRASVWTSVRASVRASVWASVWASVYAYISTFFATKYQYDFSPAIKLWEAGLVPSFDGKTWRLHSGKNADVFYEWTPEGA